MIAKVDPGVLDAMREAFEEKAFGEYFIKSIKKTNKSQFGFSVDCEDKATFCARDEEGNYVREDVSAMWFGWQMHDEAEHKLKHPGLDQVGLRGFIVESNRDFPLAPTQQDALRELQHAEPVPVTERWLSGARWAHKRWLRSLGVER